MTDMDEKLLHRFCNKAGLLYVPPIAKGTLQSSTPMADLHASTARAANIAAYHASRKS